MANGRGHVRGRSFVRGPKRLTQWLGPADQGFVSVTGAGALIVASSSFEEPLTIVRTRGAFTLKPTSFASDLNFTGAMGMAIVSTEAFTAGIASVPEPFSDADWGGWMVWRSFGEHVQSITQAGVIYPGSLTLEIDSKAMRKVTPNETLVVVAESQAGAFDVFDGTRHLLKLS